MAFQELHYGMVLDTYPADNSSASLLFPLPMQNYSFSDHNNESPYCLQVGTLTNIHKMKGK